MISLLSTLFAGLFFVCTYVITGTWLLKKLGNTLSIFESIVFGTVLTISTFTSGIVFFGLFFGVSVYYLLLIPFILGLLLVPSFFKKMVLILQQIKANLIEVIVGCFACVVILSTLAFSGMSRNGVTFFQELHDSSWHLALVQELQEFIPPLHPSDPSIVLKNYHYFYDVFLAGIKYITNVPLLFLYFQLSTVLLTILLLATAFILGNRISGRKSGLLLVFLTAFVGSFAYFIPYFNPGQIWHESSFWVSQTATMIVNPQIFFTLAVTYFFACIVLMIFRYPKTKKIDKQYLLLHAVLIILAGTSIGFKSYAFVILSSVYALVLLFELIYRKSFYLLLLGGMYIVFSLPFVWLITEFKTGAFFYLPLWYLDSMIESPDRVNYLEWKFLEDHYRFKHNWPRVYEIKIKELIIFYIGNLGIRSLFLLLPFGMLFYKEKIRDARFLLLVFIAFLGSSVFPLLFLQTGTVWNSIQFWYYALIFANVLCLVFVRLFSSYIPKKFFIIFLILVSILALPTTVKTIYDKNKSYEMVTTKQIKLLESFTSDQKIAICPENTPLYQTALVKGISQAQIIIANPFQLELVSASQENALSYMKVFSQKNKEQLNELLDKHSVSIVLCSQESESKNIAEMLQLQPTEVDSWKVFYLP